ncbi:LacI family DNA-binding transcriptional regulator [Streptococcus merionis]|uniref:LacI family DNA-binding transcriptional regulator n=1 Tax=Streptococcus merionis TaxID=400065 RepID=UPI003511C7B7
MATMKDVAHLAGVGVGTVSRVINNGQVKASTRQKVEEAIAQLNYEPDNYARGLKLQKTFVVALILPTVWHPFYGEFAYHVENELAKLGYKCMICNSDGRSDRELEYIKMMQQNKVDGIIALTYSDIDPYITSALPFVSVDRHFSNEAVSVSADNMGAGSLAAEILVKKGCQNIAYIGGKAKYPTEVGKRQLGFTEKSEKLGVANTFLLMSEPIHDMEGQIERFFKENPTLDGIFAINDFMALDIIRVLNHMGKSVPEDVQIIGCDGIRMAAERPIVVSTIRQPLEQMAITSVTSLIGLMNKEDVPTYNVLPISYIEGSSTKNSS